MVISKNINIKTNKKSKPIIQLFVVSLVYLFLLMLWYNIRHIFPDYNESLNISDSEMTLLMAILGWVSLPGYFIGGWFADRFDAKKLLSISCFLTAITSFWLSTILFGVNSHDNKSGRLYQLYSIYFIWGLIQGCLFYAASVKVMSFLAGKNDQVSLFAKSRWICALVGAIVILGLGYLFKMINYKITVYGRKMELSLPLLVLFISIVITFLGLYVWIAMDSARNNKDVESFEDKKVKLTKKDILEVLKNPRVWMMSITILGFALLAETQDFAVNMFKKNLGISNAVVVPISTFTNYGDDFIMLPLIMWVGKRVKSYLKAVIIVGTTFSILTLVVILIPFINNLIGALAVIILCLIIYKFSGFVRSFFWSTRWSQIQELNIRKHQYGLVVGIFCGVAFSSEGWYEQIASSIQGKAQFIQGKDKNGNGIANLHGNQLIISIAIILALICFSVGIILYLINRKGYLSRGKDTYRIISDTPQAYYDKDKEIYSLLFSKKLISLMGGENNIISFTFCSTKLDFIIKDWNKIDKKNLSKLPILGIINHVDRSQIIMGFDAYKIGNIVKQKIYKKRKKTQNKI